MSDPTTRLGRLSLENMTTNPSRAQEAPRQAFVADPYPHRGEDQGSSSSEQEEEEDEEEDDDNEHSDIDMSTDSGEGADGPRLIRSPSRLLYDLQKLPRRDRALVRDAFDDPPRLALQRCRRMDNYYAFQMTELVTRSVRIYAGDHNGHDGDESRTSSSSAAPRLSCSCHPEKKKSSGSKGRRDNQEEGEKEDDNDDDEETGEGQTTCPHLLWLLDQILHQTLYGRARHEPVTMAPGASHAQEMGDPFAAIAEHHLDVLAAGLHCPVVDPESDARDDGNDDENDDSQREEEEPDATRVLEARELLAAVYDAPDPDRFRPDIFDRGTPIAGTKVVKRRDLDRTVLRMLLDNHHFFNYFLAQARPLDPVRDPFRKLAQRADHVLRLLHRHQHHHQQHHDRAPAGTSSGATGRRPDRRSAEAPHNTDAAWASRHILGAVRTVESSIFSRQRPLSRQEALSAARTLVHILDIVVPSSPPPPPPTTTTTTTQRSSSSSHAGRETADLYNMLIGNNNNKDFVIGVLGLLPEAASQFVHSLETVLDRIGVHGAPATYVERFRALLRRLRASGSGHGVKRPKRGQSTDQLVKRMK